MPSNRATIVSVLQQIEANRGICVVLGDPRCELAIGLAKSSELMLYVQVQNEEGRQAACRAADAAGLYGTTDLRGQRRPRENRSGRQLRRRGGRRERCDGRSAERGATSPATGRQSPRWAQRSLTKPLPDGSDDWSHHYHGPDNNPQSNDAVVRAPYLTQFVAEPRYAPAPQNVVASAGRVFMAFGHVAWKQRAEPWLDTLVAINGFNGTLLWKRELTSGIMVDRSTMIATPTVLYLADEKSCKLLDPATGELRDEITVPADLTGGTFWKWMALSDGVLYALVGEQEPLDAVKRWRRTAGGWPWNEISDGYNANDPPNFDFRTWNRQESFDQRDHAWGFSKTLLAIDPHTKKILWRHQEELPIDSRTLCMKNGRIYFSHFSRYIVCLNAKSGEEIWRRTAENDPELFKAIGPYCPYEVASTGWRSTIYARCSDEALIFAGPQVFDVTAVSTADGRHLWTYHATRNPHVLVRDDGVYIIGAGGLNGDTHKLDPLSGKVLASYNISRTSCTRATGCADSIFFRGGGDGTIRLEPASSRMQWFSPMRPSCFVGTLVADGHLYWIPWECDCNLQMFGVICCGPAGDAEVRRVSRHDCSGSKHPAARRQSVAPLEQSPADWPTYRGNNARTATTPVEIPESVSLLWKFTPQSAFEATPPVATGGSGIPERLRRDRPSPGRCEPAVCAGRPIRAVRYGIRRPWPTGGLWSARATDTPTLSRQRQAGCCGGSAPPRPIAGSASTTRCCPRGRWPRACWLTARRRTSRRASTTTTVRTSMLWTRPAVRSSGRTAARTAWERCWARVWPSRATCCWTTGSSTLPVEAYCRRRRSTWPPGRSPQWAKEVTAAASCSLSPPRAIAANLSAAWWPLASLCTPHRRARFSIEIPGCSGVKPWWQRKTHTSFAALIKTAGNSWPRTPRATSQLWEQPLPSEPVRWAIAVDARSRIVVTLRDGRVLCFGSAP